MTTQSHTTTTPNGDGLDWLEFVKVGTDRFKPTFTQLRAEGLSKEAIETLYIARESITVGCTADEVAAYLRLSQDSYPIGVDDVWPTGVPEQWQDWSNYDPTDEEMAVSLNGPDAPEVHRAAYRLHMELHDRTAS